MHFVCVRNPRQDAAGVAIESPRGVGHTYSNDEFAVATREDQQAQISRGSGSLSEVLGATAIPHR